MPEDHSAVDIVLARIEARRLRPPLALVREWEGTLRGNALLLVTAVATTLNDRVRGRLLTLGTDSPELEILEVLHGVWRMGERQLANIVDLPDFDQWLIALEAKQAITRRRAGPSTVVRLTMLGEALAAAGVRARDEALEECFNSLPEEETFALVLLLGRLHRG